MSRWPPPYPRVPHIAPAPGAAVGDRVLVPDTLSALLRVEVEVEEKVDGANVMLWLGVSGTIDVASRSGPGAVDRAGQLGPLRAWAAAHADRLRKLLGGGRVLYGEWLWFTHTIGYDALPDLLVGLDLLDPDGMWVGLPERDAELDRTGLTRPPALFRGVLGDLDTLVGLSGPSRFGSGAAEGLIVRPVAPTPDLPRVAKLVSSGFKQVDDLDWSRGRPRNDVALGSPSAHGGPPSAQ